MTAILLSIWNYLSFQTKFGLMILTFCSIAFGYFYFQKSAETNEVEEHLDKFIEGQSLKENQRADAQKSEVNKKQSETNVARNANYNRLSDEELRERLIKQSREIK